MPDREVERRAEGLTNDQSFALRSAGLCKGGEYWTPYQRLFTRKHSDLVRGGVLQPLGERVRDSLLKTKER